MKNSLLSIKNCLALTFIFGFLYSNSQTLVQNFKNPPASAKPQTWFHVISGNMSKEGITKDLEAIARAGIGGTIFFNVAQGVPLANVTFNSEAQRRLLKHAAAESERLGLTFGFHNCDGWSSSGGPWVNAENSMKMVVYSEKVVDGNPNISLQLAQPTAREGFYRDIAVIAYPALPSEVQDAENKVFVTSSDPDFNVSVATDGLLDQATKLKASDTQPGYVVFDYGKPTTIRSYFMLMSNTAKIILEKSDDGVRFEKVSTAEMRRTGKSEYGVNEHFGEVTARYFRITSATASTIKEISLSATYPIENTLGRILMNKRENEKFPAIGDPDSSMVINKSKIINLTQFMDPAGRLKTGLPAGKWTIMRFGFTSTGAVNVPASNEGRGLEVDKFDRAALKVHYDAYIKKVIDAAKPVAPKALQYVEIDSYEVGSQNWTKGFENIFKARYNYDILSFLPLFAGRFVESAKSSELVTGDLRNLYSQLMCDNYFGYFQELMNKDGIKAINEPYGNGPFNELDAGKFADLPMGEFWLKRGIFNVGAAVSSGHIYGKQKISTESFTAQDGVANWNMHPAMAKLTGDRAWTYGVNFFMFHRFAHQANTHVSPGMTMNRWGSNIDRTQTWWENAGATWFKYLARGQYLLQQGNPVSDLLIFVGDQTPNGFIERNDFPIPIPWQVNYDCVNKDVLVNRLSVKNGRMVLPEGTAYRLLALRNCDKITLESLRKINELAKNGIVIIGKKPVEPAGYIVSKEQTDEFKALVNTIWSKKTTYEKSDWMKIYSENNIKNDLLIGNRTDISFIHRQTDKEDFYFFFNPDSVPQTFNCRFNVKGKIPELWNPMTGETNKLAQFVESEGMITATISLNAESSTFVVFRESSNEIRSVLPSEGMNSQQPIFSFSEDNKIKMTVAKNGNYPFVLSTNQKKEVNVTDIDPQIIIAGPWQVKFDKKYGYEGMAEVQLLTDWKDSQVDGIQHYSGTAVYQNSFVLPAGFLNPGKRVKLDLGKVSIAARIYINNKERGVLWIAPFKTDITDALVTGKNDIRIEVTNLWSNRLIGDEGFPDTSGFEKATHVPTNKMVGWYVQNKPMPAGQRTTFTTQNFYKSTDPLVSSGLIGPVSLSVEKTTTITE